MAWGEMLVHGWRWMGWELAAVGRTVQAAVRASGPERDTMVQSLKAAAAAIAAWALTGWWLTAPLALMAPWTALALVDATVYRSIRAGLQQLAVIVIGALWASAAMALTGGHTLGSMIIALPVLVLIGSYRRLGTQGVYGATTALFVITYGAYSLSAVGHRLLETAIGAVIGICVNAFVLPPVHLRNVRDQLQRLARDSAALLHTMAEALHEEDWDASDAAAWHDRARRLTQLLRSLSEARQWSDESFRYNPGLRLRRTGPPPPPTEADTRWEHITDHLHTLTRSLAGTAGERARLTAPGSTFLLHYADLAERLAELCEAEERRLGATTGDDPSDERQARAADEAQRCLDRLADLYRGRDGTVAVAGVLLAESRQLVAHLAPAE